MLEVISIPALNDNYIYLLRCSETGTVAIVDPGEVAPVIEALEREGLTLDVILNTHHHYDHTDGNKTLMETYKCDLIAPANEARIKGVTQGVREGDVIKVGACTAQVIETPAHTRTHISFYFQDDNALFCGDTLFSIGCGRLFEGDAAQMFESLQKLKALPDETRVYCAHEYTLANIAFAKTLRPDDAELLAFERDVQMLRAQGHSSLPSLMKQEKTLNPFLYATSAEEFGRYRAAKDGFKV